MKTQIHESFKPFLVHLQDGKLTKASSKALNSFMNESHIHARSISAIPFPGDDSTDENIFRVLICIGHDEKKAKKSMKYEVSIKKLGVLRNPLNHADVAMTDLETAVKALNKLSKKAQNVVCHSLLSINETGYAVLLTAKETK